MECYDFAMINKKRKRAAGGGRKPRGPYRNKDKTLSTSITSELRARLDQEVVERQWSLSQVVEDRLQKSFMLPEELQRAWGPPHVKALAQLISRVVRSVESSCGGDVFADTDKAWHRNAFTHAAVSTAINALLAHYRPAGAVETPSQVKALAERLSSEMGRDEVERNSTPESVGMASARGLIYQTDILQPPPLNPPAGAHYAEGFYVLPDIRSILGESKK